MNVVMTVMWESLDAVTHGVGVVYKHFIHIAPMHVYDLPLQRLA